MSDPLTLFSPQAVDDVILRIDGASVTGNSQDEVARKIAGPEGTSVRITYRIRKYFQVPPRPAPPRAADASARRDPST